MSDSPRSPGDRSPQLSPGSADQLSPAPTPQLSSTLAQPSPTPTDQLSSAPADAFLQPPAEAFMFHVIILILAVTGVIILIRLPRALARFSRSSEWQSGHFFWNTSDQKSNVLRSFAGNYSSERISAKEMRREEATDDSHSPYSYANKAGSRSDDNLRALGVSYPPHIAVSPRFLQPLVILHRSRLSPGFSIFHALLVGFYFAIMAYATFYRSNPFTDPVRAGWVAVAQLPILFALATKNNILGMLLGFSYAKLNFLHRFIGRLIVLAANIHGLAHIYKMLLTGTYQEVRLPSTIWGIVALVVLDCLFFFSLSFWRTKFHNVMYLTHIVGAALVIPALWLHKPAMIPWLCACIALYGLDHVLRILKTRVATAVIRQLPELNTTCIEVRHINGGWRAGQYVRLRVLSFGVGWLGWTEVHSFTIASVSDGHEGLVLMAKKSGKWTSRLYDMAKSEGSTADFGRNVKVMIEGPYGGPGHAIFSSYSAAVFVVAGSGITFALSAMQELIRKDLKGESRVKVIELIWTVQDPKALHPLLPRFASMIQESTYTPVRIAVHYTRAPSGGEPAAPRQPGLTLSSGRPRVAKVLEAVLSRAVSLSAGTKDSQRITGMIVGVCGPAALGDDVNKAVASIDSGRRDQIGGIEVHEESFGM